MKPIQILLVEITRAETDDFIERLTSSQLREVRLTRVDRESALNHLRETAGVDLVLLELGMPSEAELATIAAIRHATADEVPIVALADRDDEEIAVAAIRTGAKEFLARSQADAATLARTIRCAVERQQAERRERHMTAVLHGIRRVNQLITRERDPHGLAQSTCELLVQARGYTCAWIQLHAAEAWPRIVAKVGLDERDEALPGIMEEAVPRCIALARDSSDTQFLRERGQVCEGCPAPCSCDVVSDLRFDGASYGALGITFPAGIVITPEELELLREVSADLAFALTSMRSEYLRQQSDKRYRLLVEHALAGIATHEMIFDADGRAVDYRFLSANRAFETQTGLSWESLRDRTAREAIPGIEKTSFIDIFGEVVRAGSPCSFEMWSEPLNRHFSISAYPMEKNQFGTIFIDITERVLAQNEIVSLSRFPADNPNPVVRVTAEGVLLFANAASQPLLDHWQLTVGQALPEVWQERMHQALCVKKTTSLEVELGSRTYAFTLAPILDGSYVNLYALDITDRKQSEERFRQLYEHMSQGVVFQSANGHIIFANPAAQRILGLDEELLRQRDSSDPCWQAIHEDGTLYPGDQHPGMVALRTGLPADGIMGIHNPEEQRRRWLLIHAIPEFRPGETTPYRVFTTFEDITPRKDVERAAKRNEARLTSLVSIFQHDAESVQPYLDNALAETLKLTDSTLGYVYHARMENQEYLLSTWTQAHTEQGSHSRLEVRRALETAGILQEALRQHQAILHDVVGTADNAVLARYIGVPVVRDGQMVAVVGVANKSTAYDDDDVLQLRLLMDGVFDTLARKQAEWALRDQQHFLAAVLDSLHDHIAVLDDTGRIVLVNEAWHQFASDNDYQPLPKDWTTLNYLTVCDQACAAGDAIAGEAARQIRAVIAGEKTDFSLEYPCHGPDVQRWFHLHVSPLSGTQRWIVLAHENITTRWMADKALRQNERLLNGIFDVLPVGLWFTDRDGHINRANPAGRRIWGAEPLVGMDEYGVFKARRLPSGEEVAADDWAIVHSMRDGRTILDEVIEIDAFDGVKRVILNSTAPVLDEDGNLQGGIIVNNDITAKYHAEAERDLLEEQLRQAQKMEAVGLLAGGIAHDFNNLLSIIIGRCQLTRMRMKETHALSKDIDEIATAADRAATLTRQLLAFSRKQPLAPVVLSLNNLVIELQKMLRRLIGEDIDLVTLLAPDLGEVKADPGQLEQVIMNLAINARDAMPDGGRLTIETANVMLGPEHRSRDVDPMPGPHVMLAITDTGCGMDAATREHVFEPFFTTKAHGKGTGLGLATVFGIVKQSGGYIWLYTEVGEGTTFKIYLPRIHDSEASATFTVSAASLPCEGDDELILVVEDEPSIRLFLDEALQGLGYRVEIAANGAEALGKIEQGLRPDLMLTDVIMPGMSGKVLADRIRSQLPELPILYMSGYTDSAIEHHGVLDEDTPFIQKPFNVMTLASRLRQLLASD